MGTGAGIQDPKTIFFPAIRPVGMAVQHDLRPFALTFRLQRFGAHFHAVAMSMGHQHFDTKHRCQDLFRL